MHQEIDHFRDEEWSDFVRHLKTDETGKSMQRHLDGGCTACREAHLLWKLIFETGRRDAQYVAPEPVVDSVKDNFPFRRNPRLLPRLADMAHLVFDSFLEPMPVGIRGGNIPPRQLLHETENFFVDLWLVNGPRSRVHVTGQVVNKEGRQPPRAAGVILARHEDQVVAQTIANALGEFQLEIDDMEKLKIYISMPDSVIGIGLPGHTTLTECR